MVEVVVDVVEVVVEVVEVVEVVVVLVEVLVVGATVDVLVGVAVVVVVPELSVGAGGRASADDLVHPPRTSTTATPSAATVVDRLFAT